MAIELKDLSSERSDSFKFQILEALNMKYHELKQDATKREQVL